MVRRARPSRGFTLLELMVAGAVALFMLTAALAVFSRAAAMQRKQRVKMELKRSAELVMGQLTSELRQAGLGRPRGTRAEPGGEAFPPALLVAEAQRIVFVADLPRWNSNFNGFSQLADSQPASSVAGVALLNELNGGCDVYSPLGHCSTLTESALFSAATDPSFSHCGGNANSATCPWGLRRYRSGESLLVVNDQGQWVERQIGATLHLDVASGVPLVSRRLLRLSAGLPSSLFSGTNLGFASTPDRVFYRMDTGTGELLRNQCWGPVGSPVSISSLTSAPCAQGDTTGTGWEPLARGLSTIPGMLGLSFTYLNAAGTVVTAPVPAGSLANIRRVDITLRLHRQLGRDGLVEHEASASIYLRQ